MTPMLFLPLGSHRRLFHFKDIFLFFATWSLRVITATNGKLICGVKPYVSVLVKHFSKGTHHPVPVTLHIQAINRGESAKFTL